MVNYWKKEKKEKSVVKKLENNGKKNNTFLENEITNFEKHNVI